jgi:hypothetical protein
MGLQRIQTVQAHPVPKVIGSAGVPWEPQLFHRPERMASAQPEGFPPGATVQNGMKGVPLFSCDSCGEVVAETEIPFHDCGLAETDDDD